MRVDVHTHWMAPEYFDLLADHGAAETLESFKVFSPMLHAGAKVQHAAGLPAVVESRIAEMDGCGVDLAVVSIGALQPYFPDERTATTVARRANTMLHEVVEAGRPRLTAFGSLPLPHAGASTAELAFCLDDCGFAGVNLGTSAAGLPLDAPELDEVWAALDERRTTVLIHPGTTPLMGVGGADFHLAPDFCSPTETSLALCRLITGRVTTRYPNVRIIAVAMGGTIPLFAHRFDLGLRRSHPDLYEEIGGVLPQLRRFWYDTSMVDEPYVLDAVRQSTGVDRLVLGSDLPRGPLSEMVDFVTTSTLLTEAEKTEVLDVQGAMALGLEPSGPRQEPGR